MNVDREKLREIVRQKVEEKTDEIVQKLARFMVNPNPQTTLDAEKGLHADTTRVADAIFKEIMREVLTDQQMKDAAAREWKKKATPSTKGDGKPQCS